MPSSIAPLSFFAGRRAEDSILRDIRGTEQMGPWMLSPEPMAYRTWNELARPREEALGEKENH